VAKERGEGHSNFLLKRGERAGEAAQKFCSPRFYLNFRAKAASAKKPLCWLDFLVTFSSRKK
jgi:hypothetical protein